MTKNKETAFRQYGLSAAVCEALEALNYLEPTTIQQEVIPLMLGRKNVAAKAPTGSGKTAAFAIPICEMTVWEENLPQALVLEPTRELTDQVKDELFRIGRKKRLKVPAVFGGFPIDKQIQTLRQKSHIVVGTPGRILDHARRGSLKFEQMSCCIIDEADLMLDMGFMEDVRAILKLLPGTCSISLFSATLKPEIRQLAEQEIPDTVYVECEQEPEAAPDICEKLYEVSDGEKYDAFIRVLTEEKPERCIIFCGTREMAGVLFQKLRRNRVFCGVIHGELDQKERLKTIAAFRRGGFRYLIATDVAARGIDIDDISHVMNYDFPTGRETYVHRIGRTGRNGKAGTAVSFVGASEKRMQAMVEEYIGRTIPVFPVPEPDEEQEKTFWQHQKKPPKIKESRTKVLNQGITRLIIGGGRKSKIRAGDIVGAVCGIEGLEVTDIGIIDIRDSLSYVEILNQKGSQVLDALQNKPVKGKVRKVRIAKGR
ncbi:MAG: DEAD/DEAH box helicase [Lachnospiraceae bacterium]